MRSQLVVPGLCPLGWPVFFIHDPAGRSGTGEHEKARKRPSKTFYL